MNRRVTAILAVLSPLIIASAVALGPTSVNASPSSPEAKDWRRFKSCEDTRSISKYGFAPTPAIARQAVKLGYHRPNVSRVFFRAAVEDLGTSVVKDGVACPVVKSPTPTPTPPPPPETWVPVEPWVANPYSPPGTMWNVRRIAPGTIIPLGNATRSKAEIWVRACSGEWFEDWGAKTEIVDASGSVLGWTYSSYDPVEDGPDKFGCKTDIRAYSRETLSKYPTATGIRVVSALGVDEWNVDLVMNFPR